MTSTLHETQVGFPDLRDDDMIHIVCCDQETVTLCGFRCQPLGNHEMFVVDCLVCEDLKGHPSYCPTKERCAYSD